MTHRFVSQLTVALAASVVAFAAAVACSSAPPDTTGGSSTKKPTTPASDSDDDKTPATNSPSNPAPTTPLTDSGECGKKADADSCADCCMAKSPGAGDKADDVYFDCICAATACATACSVSVCATADNMNEPTAECKTCLDTNDATCETKATATCDADPACKALDACFVSQCDPLDKSTTPPAGGGKIKQAKQGLNARLSKQLSSHQR